MSANLNGEKEGKAAMMYVGDQPWHGLGTKLTKEATSAEAIKAARLDWKVKKEPIFFKSGAELKAIEGKFATVRQDTKESLGVVGARYTELQNEEAFSFFDGIVGIKEAMYHTAGALGNGEKVWLMAKLPGYVKVIGHDVTEKYLLLSNSHDGSGSVKVLFTPIRVVCQNTLNIALQGASGENTFRMRHTPGMGMKIEEAQEALGIVSAKFSMFEDMARKLATTELTVAASKKYFANVASRTGEAAKLAKGEKPAAKTQAIIDEMSRLFEEGRGAELKGAKGTAWGAFNAVAEFVDYYRGTSGETNFDVRMNRADSMLFGTGAAMKNRGWADALALAGIK